MTMSMRMDISINIYGIVNISIGISDGITTRLKINISISSNIVIGMENIVNMTMWTGILQLEMLVGTMTSKWFPSQQPNPCRGSPNPCPTPVEPVPTLDFTPPNRC